MSDFYYASPIGGPGFPPGAGAAFGTFTTYQDVSPVPAPRFPSALVKPGTKIFIRASGEFSTTATPTLQIGSYWGTAATPLAQSAATTTGTAAAWPWQFELDGVFASIGSSGSLICQGLLSLGTSLTALTVMACPVTAAARTVTVDTTTDKTIGIGAAYSASSASNTIKVNTLIVAAWN